MKQPAREVDEVPSADGVPRAELDSWRAFGVTAGITLRGDGFNLGLVTQERASRVTERWRGFQRAHAPAFSRFVLSLQVHGTRIATHTTLPVGWLLLDGFDGHLTSEAGILLLVTVADCVPVYLLHPSSGTVALLHAGWRGTADGILETGLRQTAAHAGASPSEIVMHCGVGICGDCYEVGPEVIRRVTGRSATGPGLLDLRAELVARAARAGLSEMTVSGWCAAHHEDRFFSHRREGSSAGRMVAFLGRGVAGRPGGPDAG